MILLGVLGVLALLALSRSAGATGSEPSSRNGGGVRVHPEIVSRVNEWRRTVEQEADRPGLWTSLVLALIARESGGDSLAKGPTEDYGLMQITRPAWQDYVRETSDPEAAIFPDSLYVGAVNIRVGSWILSERVSIMGSMFDALRAYNAGVVGARRAPTLGAEYARWILEVGEPAFRVIA